MPNRSRRLAIFCLLFPLCAFADWRSGMVDIAAADNQALMVGAPNGLPGIDTDLDNTEAMLNNPAYNFQTTRLYDSAASKQALLQNLKRISSAVAGNGTFLFYFSGHGNKGIIAADRMQVVSLNEIRAAIEQSRGDQGPLARLILIFDSCNAGSMLDGMRAPLTDLTPQRLSTDFAQAALETFTDSRADYWRKLFVFASSTADETSAAGDSGSLFTESMRKAFADSVGHGTIGDFIGKTKAYTGSSQHPVARLVPASLSSEPLRD